jgi:hypothetical protein
MNKSLLVLSLAFLWSVPGAFADMIPSMPPMSCSPGSVPVNSHNGAHCYPTKCKADSDCNDGALCQTQGLCITTESATDRTQKKYTYEVAGAACSSKEKCPSGGGTCKIVKRCVMPKKAETPTPVDPPKSEPVSIPASVYTQKSEPASAPRVDPTINQTPPSTKKGKGDGCAVSPAGDNVSALALFAMVLLFVRGKKRRST